MLALPLDSTLDRTDSKGPSHRLSVSTASAAGGSRSSSWSTRDDETLIQARAQGLNWNQIGPKHFPNKTPNACRKRHERLMERQNAEQWDGVKLDVLAQAYMEVRRDMWSILAARVGEKWQLVETKCMEKGLKNLTQAYRSAQKKLENGTYHDHDDSGHVQHARNPRSSLHYISELPNPFAPTAGTEHPVHAASDATPAPHAAVFATTTDATIDATAAPTAAIDAAVFATTIDAAAFATTIDAAAFATTIDAAAFATTIDAATHASTGDAIPTTSPPAPAIGAQR
ncbi:Myb-DNA-bind-6 multi-domain protein [Pyrenophora tritici-repentis]|nr:Myb-DNA-bind-6 multi-domain protein [Pyrenophora tritici-repentis]